MENIIVNQIQILQELRSKCLETTGYYGDIDTAIAALQICSTFGMDNTARLLGILNNNGIKTHEDLLKVINDSKLSKLLSVIENESNEVLCPNCNGKLNDKSKHCPECGQKLNFEDIFVKTSVLFDFENTENTNNNSSE